MRVSVLWRCRCVSQMVLARVSNVKSGWKSMFMVFTTAANDESPMIVRLAFDTVEKIVREHFDYITETEVGTACHPLPWRSSLLGAWSSMRAALDICTQLVWLRMGQSLLRNASISEHSEENICYLPL